MNTSLALKLLLGVVGIGAIVGIGMLLPGNGGTSEEDRVVATVNEREIRYEQLDFQLAQLEADPQTQSLVPPQEDAEARAAFETRIVEQLVDEYLLYQEAERQGIAVTDEEVTAQVEVIQGQFESEEQFEQQLTTLRTTKDELREEVRRQMVNTQFQQKVIEDNDIVIEAEEVSVFYEQIGGGQEGVPPLEEVEGQIRAELERQKAIEIMQGIVAQLRETADIQILL